MKSFKSYVTAGVGFAMLVTIIFLSTGWGSAVAAQITNVFVTNDASHPVPVHEQGTVVVQQTGTPVHFQLIVPPNGQFPTYTVPAGKRLEIQYIKGFVIDESGDPGVEIIASGNFDQNFPDRFNGDEIDEQVTIYLGPGEFLQVHTGPDEENYARLDFYGVLTNA
jgi:hypothetical protein